MGEIYTTLPPLNPRIKGTGSPDAWQAAGLWESDDGGQTVKFTPYKGDLSIAYNASGTGVGTGTNTTRFDGLFSDAGYYIVEVQCTADVHDCSTGQVINSMSAVGYIGGSASDVGEGGDTAHAMRAYATAGGGGGETGTRRIGNASPYT